MKIKFGNMSTSMYASAIRDAIASGDVEKMKAAAQQAEQQIKEQGDLSVALLELQAAIKKLKSK